MSDLADLIARVEGATGPDRAIDYALMKLFDPNLFLIGLEEGPLADGDERQLTDTADSWCVIVSHKRGGSANGGYRKISASIDAALALVERKLPGWIVETIGQQAAGEVGSLKGFGWCVELTDGSHALAYHAKDKSPQGQAPTLPLAIILALLRSIQAGAQN